MSDVSELLGSVGIPGEPLNEACADDTGGDGDGTYSQERKYDGEDRAGDSHRINVSVSDGKNGGDTPPESREGIFEDLRLRHMLRIVHADASRQHQNEDDEKR